MSISTLLTQTTWTDANALQPDSQTPLIVTAYSDSRPTQYVQTTMLLPAATQAPLALPVPASWSNVYAVQLTNIDTATNNGNYVLVTTPQTGASAVTATFGYLVGGSSNLSNTNAIVLTVGTTSTTFTAVTSGATGHQFNIGGTVALSLAAFAAAVNAAAIGVTATAVTGTGPTTIVTLPGAVVTSSAWAPLVPITFPSSVTYSVTNAANNTLMLAPLGGTFSSSNFLGASQGGTPLNLGGLTVQAVSNTGTYAGSSATQLYVYLAGA